MKKIFLIIIFNLLSANVYSYDLFETNFNNVEFVSNNIESVKINKINELKLKSFLNVLKKTIDQDSFDEIEISLTEDFINTFVKNIIINEEIIINDKYLSKIKINFDKKKIIEFFRKNSIPYVEYYPENILLIIYEKNKFNEYLLSKNNNFYSYFNKNLSTNSLFKIPKLDINDRYILNKQDIKKRNFNKVINFSQKYNLNEIIIVIADLNNEDINYNLIFLSKGQIFEKKIKYNKINFKEFYKTLESESINMWKKLNHIQNDTVSLISCNIDYFNILELKEIRKKLKKISIIKNLNIKSLSFKNIEYDIYYYGNFKIFTKILDMNKLKLKHLNNNCSISLI